MMSTLEILKAARELLSDEKRWTQGAYARNKAKEDVPEFNPDAICFCMLGSIYRSVGDYSRAQTAAQALRNVLPCPIPTFNDDLDRKHSEILAKFDEAIARLEGQQA